jgi:cysteine synthase
MRLAVGFGESPFHKWHMARAGMLDGIRSMRIAPGTTIVEATSGNTGFALAMFCNALGLSFVPVIPGDVPSTKVDAIRAFGNGVSPMIHHSKEVTTVERARELGRQWGWYNPDQYAGAWNEQAHYHYLAPQLFSEVTPSLLFVPGGTMGTCLGLERYVREKHLPTKIVPVMCAPGEAVPAARTLARVKRDVQNGWPDVFDEADIAYGSRHAAFLASFQSWREVPVQIGPSSGLALASAFGVIEQRLSAGTLDELRSDAGTVEVVVFCPDDARQYLHLYFGELTQEEFSGSAP